VNPPYGVRLGDEASAAWRALGALLPRLAGWRSVVLAPDRGLERLLPLAPAASLPVSNGGIRCRLLRYGP
jgi:putative N6-adenine-specific DNA methylase